MRKRTREEKKKRSKPRLAVAITAEFSLSLSVSFLDLCLPLSFLFPGLSRGQLGLIVLQVVLGLGSRNGKIEHVVLRQGVLCCTPVRPKWCRSGGAVGCEVQEQVGQVISAWMRVACSSPKASAPWLGDRREKVSRSGLGWAGLGGTARSFPL